MWKEDTTCYFEAKMAVEGTQIIKIFEGYYADLLHTGDSEEADKPIDNIVCQDILINIFDCDS